MKVVYGLEKKTIDTLEKDLFVILANTHILYVKTLNYHWNVENAAFQMYHELFEDQYKQLATAVDDIAERIRMMGRQVEGTLSAFLKAATIKEAKKNLSAKEMVKDLAQDHEKTIKVLRNVIDISEEFGDIGTADFLTALLRDHEKTAWFLRSHL